MDAVFLSYPEGGTLLDAAGRADGKASATLLTAVKDLIAHGSHLLPPKGKTLMERRLLPQVEEIPFALVELEDGKYFPGFFCRIYFFHIRIVAEDFAHQACPQFPDPAPDGNRHGGEGVSSFHTGEGNEMLAV